MFDLTGHGKRSECEKKRGGLPLSVWKQKSLRETRGKWGEEDRTMWWEVSAETERGQGAVTT